jgi:hypothetical protein
MIYLCNAFSLQMVDTKDLPRVRFSSTQPAWIELKNATSAIGHDDLAEYLGVKKQRIQVKLTDGDELLIAQVTRGRLPEGTTEVPDLEPGDISWVRVQLENQTMVR